MTTTLIETTQDPQNSTELTPTTDEKPYTVVAGNLVQSSNRLMSGKDGVLALINGKTLTDGAISANITANTDKKTALVFG